MRPSRLMTRFIILTGLALLGCNESPPQETPDGGVDPSKDTGTMPGPDPDPWKVTNFFIELTEDDIEVQSFVDGSRWRSLRVTGPDDRVVFEAATEGNMAAQGLSELKVDGNPSHFPIVGDPEHVEIEDIDVFLAEFPAGTYVFEGETVDGKPLRSESVFTHDLPALPEILVPSDADEPDVLDSTDAVLSWEPVTESYGGAGSIDIVGYEVIVEQVDPFRKLSINLPASETTLTIPPEFLSADALYDVEIVAIEKSANQTISVGEFRTSTTAEAPPETPGDPDRWKIAKFFIELTEDDIEVQAFVDGSRWKSLEVVGPGGQVVFDVGTGGNMAAQGLSELKLDGNPSHFPIVGDPAHVEIEDISVFLQAFPTGTYAFSGETVGGRTLTREATFSHALPALPEIIVPADSDEPEVLDPANAVLRWEPVTVGYEGSGPVTIVGYEVIVEQVDPFRKLSIVVPPTVTSLTIPPEFLSPDALYDVEIVAIEQSANQTITTAEFTTAP